MLKTILRWLGFSKGPDTQLSDRLDKLTAKARAAATKERPAPPPRSPSTAEKRLDKIVAKAKEKPKPSDFLKPPSPAEQRLDKFAAKARLAPQRAKPSPAAPNDSPFKPDSVEVKPDLTPSRYFGQGAVWNRVTSSNVASVAYFNPQQKEGATGILGVRFLGKKGGRESEYWYWGVKASVFINMMASSSKGRFVWTDLRDKYPYMKMR